MPLSFIGAYFVLIVAAVTLLYVALTDLKEFKIRNELIFILVGLINFLSFCRANGEPCTGILRS